MRIICQTSKDIVNINGKETKHKITLFTLSQLSNNGGKRKKVEPFNLKSIRKNFRKLKFLLISIYFSIECSVLGPNLKICRNFNFNYDWLIDWVVWTLLEINPRNVSEALSLFKDSVIRRKSPTHSHLNAIFT